MPLCKVHMYIMKQIALKKKKADAGWIETTLDFGGFVTALRWPYESRLLQLFHVSLSFENLFFVNWSFPGGSVGKESACNVGDTGSIPESGRSPGEGNGNLLQDSCLENSLDRGSGQATVHGVTKSQTQLCDFHLKKKKMKFSFKFFERVR